MINLHERMLPTSGGGGGGGGGGLNPRPPGLQSDGASNWATEALHKYQITLCRTNNYWETDLNVKNLSESLDRKLYITLKSSRQTVWARFMMITSKMWPLEHQQRFPLIWPGGLVSDIKWLSFKLNLKIIKTSILSNIYDDYFKNVTSGVLTVFCWFGLIF